MKKRFLSFSHYLFFSVIAIYCVFVASFLYYQYHREKEHKVELLNSTLTMFNAFLYEHLSDPAFDVDECVKRAKNLNPAIEIFTLSGRTGENFSAWTEWLRKSVKEWKSAERVGDNAFVRHGRK